jgi:glycosyltransferase involved in cell wall biosynthesis
MYITVLTSSYPRFPGDGTAPFVQSIAEELAGLGHQVAVVAPYDEAVQKSPGGRVTERRFRYAPLDRWHIMGHAQSLTGDTQLRPGVFFLLPFFLLAEFMAGMRIARRQGADVIHAHWVLPNGLVGAWMARILRRPLAISLHGSDIFVALRNPLFGRVARWVFCQADVVTACSEDLRQGALTLGAAPEKVHLIPWGADPERFHPEIPPLDRSSFGLEAEDTVLVGLGRIVPKKGFDVLVRALPQLVGAHPHLHVVIGGDGPQREDLADLAKQLGVGDHLHLPGRIPWDDVPAFLAMGDVFLQPSVLDEAGNQDGLPTVLLEAMGVGLPPVCSRICGIPLVVEDRVNGLLFPAGDPDALAESIDCLMSQDGLRARLARDARSAVEERLNWRQVARQFAALFEQARE